jgi:hypothetical protein
MNYVNVCVCTIHWVGVPLAGHCKAMVSGLQSVLQLALLEGRPRAGPHEVGDVWLQ